MAAVCLQVVSVLVREWFCFLFLFFVLISSLSLGLSSPASSVGIDFWIQGQECSFFVFLLMLLKVKPSSLILGGILHCETIGFPFWPAPVVPTISIQAILS